MLKSKTQYQINPLNPYSKKKSRIKLYFLSLQFTRVVYFWIEKALIKRQFCIQEPHVPSGCSVFTSNVTSRRRGVTDCLGHRPRSQFIINVPFFKIFFFVQLSRRKLQEIFFYWQKNWEFCDTNPLKGIDLMNLRFFYHWT